MKVVILAGGRGTRISEETTNIPKPMVEVGGRPIIWHIMKTYSHFGFNDFIVCLGYKGYMIKEYFAHYLLHEGDVTIDLKKEEITASSMLSEPWKVTLVDTGLETMTGGRIKRIQKYVGGHPFMLTYGDGVSDVNIRELIRFHKKNAKIITLTAVQPSSRFGLLVFHNENRVKSFREKPRGEHAWINAGYFVVEPGIFEYLSGDGTVFENEPLERLAMEDEMCAFKHRGFWYPMDTLRDKIYLEDLWRTGKAPWKIG